MGYNVYVTREIPKPGLDLLRDCCQILDVNSEDRVLNREELLSEVEGRDGVLCLLTDTIDDDVFAAAGPQCRVFANYAVGYNNIDINAAKQRGIQVTNTPGVLTDATADMAWSLLFAAARRIVESDSYMRTGKWTGWGPMQFLGQDITGQTLGVVGAGRIGAQFALKSIGFRMNVLYCDERPNQELEDKLDAKRVSLDKLLVESDFVSIHVPLMVETTHLISIEQFSMMKSTAVLINTSRGPIVDEIALVKALQEGQIASAGLDVYENEPRTAPGLLELANVVVCPHVASATIETRTKMAIMAAENLLAVLKGQKPPNALI